MFTFTKRAAHLAGILVAIVGAGWMLTSCKKDAKQTASASAPIDVAAGKKIFETRCVVCHGKTGMGDGPGAKALKPPPRNYTDPKWQASVTDDQLKKIIVAGGAGVGKSPLMPPNPDLKGKDAVINGLVKIIRDFKK